MNAASVARTCPKSKYTWHQ